MIALAFVAAATGMPAFVCAGIFAVLWYGSEMLLAAAAGWHLPALYPVHALMRDLLLPVLWIDAWRGGAFAWRGNEMQADASIAQLPTSATTPGNSGIAL